jgi:putative ABC transport system permease protein
MVLGMDEDDIESIITKENKVICLISMLVGLLLGTTFSKPFLSLLTSLSQIGYIKFQLSITSYIFTIGLFGLIFFIVYIKSIFTFDSLEIKDIFNHDRIADNLALNNYKYGLRGIVLIGTCIVLLYIFIRNINNPNYYRYFNIVSLISITCCFIGLYLVTSYLGALLLKLVKKSKKLYYKNLLNISEISYRFNLNKKVFFATSIMIAIVVFISGMTYSSNKETAYYAKLWNRYDLTFAQVLDMNNINENVLNNIINSGKTKIKHKSKMEFLLITKSNSAKNIDDLEDTTIIIAQSQYNMAMKQKLNIKNGNASVVRLNRTNYEKEKVSFSIQNNQYSFKIQSQLIDPFHTNKTGSLSFAKYAAIVRDTDYHKIKMQISKNYIGTYNMIDFKDWKASQNVITKLKRYLNNINPKIDSYIRDYLFSIASKITTYNDLKTDFYYLLFIDGFIGTLFFISIFSILYFKIYSYIDNMKLKYRKLYRIGMGDNELRKEIAKEIRLVFFLPLLMGLILGYSCLYALFYAADISKMFSVSLNLIFVFFVVQFIYYYLCKLKLSYDIIKSLN